MNRNIKFRGRCLDNNKWVYGDLEIRRATGQTFIHTYNDDGTYNKQHEVDPETVGQFTGWNPRKCGELYDGDIIGFDDWAFNERQRKRMKHHEGVIKWSDEYGKYQIWCSNGCYEGNDVADPQLLGNIYDNPELINDNV